MKRLPSISSMLGPLLQGIDGAVHGQEGGPQDVHRVDLRGAPPRPRPRPGALFDQRPQPSRCGAQLLAVVEAGQAHASVAGSPRRPPRDRPGSRDRPRRSRPPPGRAVCCARPGAAHRPAAFSMRSNVCWEAITVRGGTLPGVLRARSRPAGAEQRSRRGSSRHFMRSARADVVHVEGVAVVRRIAGHLGQAGGVGGHHGHAAAHGLGHRDAEALEVAHEGQQPCAPPRASAGPPAPAGR
jgi:hypothetical protein